MQKIKLNKKKIIIGAVLLLIVIGITGGVFLARKIIQKNKSKLPLIHTECQNQVCTIVDSPGVSLCQFDIDCRQEFHAECKKDIFGKFKCIEVKGPGRNQCKENKDCASGPPTYSQCKAGKCLQFFGEGKTVCKMDEECWVNPGTEEKSTE